METAEIAEITIDSYRWDPAHKALADRIMEAAGLPADVVRHIERKDGAWHCECYRINRDGSPRTRNGGPVMHIVKVQL